MLKVGLTGGLGSGKSTVASLFSQLNCPIIDADVIARELTQPNQPAWQAIVKHFGPSIVDAQGEIDRAQLRTLIFANKQQRQWLEACLHPQIWQIIEARCQTLQAPYCIIVIPLLAETIQAKKQPVLSLDRVLVVDCPQALQISRAMARDHASRQEVLVALKTQADRKTRLAIADDIIDNSGTMATLKQQVNVLQQKYLALGNRSIDGMP